LTWSGENYSNYDGNGAQQAPPVALDTTMTEADFSGKKLGSVGAQILVAFMSTKLFQAKGSLSNLHIGYNNIPEEQMRVFIAMDKLDVLCAVPIRELKANSITELDLAGKSLGTEGALVLSTYLKADTSGSLSKLTFSGDSSTLYVDLRVRFPVTIDTTMTEADFSGTNLGVSGAMILAAWLEHKVLKHTE
jgi:hypothetical protein